MHRYDWPYALELILDGGAVPRPDGGVALPIDGHDLLRRVGTAGHVDYRSLRVEDLNTVMRDCPVQFVPDDGFDPLTHPCGTLWWRLWKYTWQDKAFPRRFLLRFDVLRDGGKPAWQPSGERDVPAWTVVQRTTGSLSIEQEGVPVALAFDHVRGRKPGLHPLTTPAGRVLTDRQPRDHVWHRGVWFAWTDVQADGTALKPYDLWTEPASGVVRDGGVCRAFAGPVVQGFTHRSLWCDGRGEPAFAATWQTIAQTVDAAWRWVDLTLTLEAVRDGVVLNTAYGHLTARSAGDLRDACVLDSAAGDEPIRSNNRDDVPIEWVGYSGVKDGAPVTLLMLDHPANPGGPCWRDTFYEHRDFPIEQGALFIAVALNPLRDRPMPLPRGEPLTWTYRLVTADRPLTAAFATYHYRHWIEPIGVRLTDAQAAPTPQGI